MIVIADTGPINYLVLIGEIEVLQGLLDLRCAIERLRQTNFHIAPEILDRLLRNQ